MKLIDILVRELPKRGGWPDGAEYFVQDSDGKAKHGKKMEELSEPDSCYGVWHRGTSSGSDLPVFELDKSEDWNKSIVTREQYEAALSETKEQKMNWKYIKGSEKDFVGAPEWAVLVYRGAVRCFVGIRGQWMNEDSICAYSNFERHAAITVGEKLIAERQPITEPSWDGVGLPPVGCEVEFTNGPYRAERGELEGIIPKEGLVVEVVSHKQTSDGNNVAVVYWDDDGAGRSACFVDKCFRPLRTEADKKRDEAVKAMNAAWNLNSKMHCESIFDLIAAGKIPGLKLDN